MWCTLGCFSWASRSTMISRLRSHSGLVLHLYFFFHGLQPDDSLRALRVYRLVSIPTVFTCPLPKQIIGQSKCPHHASVDPCVHLGLLLVYTTQRALLFLSSETIRGTHILSVLFLISFPFQWALGSLRRPPAFPISPFSRWSTLSSLMSLVRHMLVLDRLYCARPCTNQMISLS